MDANRRHRHPPRPRARPLTETPMLRFLKVPIGWGEVFRRTYREVMADNCLGLAAQLAYYFFLALFPALLFLVAVLSFFPLGDLLDTVVGTLRRVAPSDVLSIVQDQIVKIAEDKNGGLLTIGMLGTIWSTSSGVGAIMDTLNQAYDIQEGRPWWKVKAIAVGLTLALGAFILVSTVLVVIGPTLAEHVAAWFHLGAAFTWTWKILQWPVVFVLVSVAVALVYYYAPDADQDWIWITPGSIIATFLWLLVSLGFKLYVTRFGSYNATYGAIGGVVVLMLWFYVSGLALLVGAEMNAEIEHASPYGKDPGEKKPGQRKQIGARAERTWQLRRSVGTFRPAIAAANCEVDKELPPAVPPPVAAPRASDWILSGLVLGEVALLMYSKLRARFAKLRV
jgi:membrane protein